MFVLIAGNVSVMANDTITGASTPLDLTNTNTSLQALNYKLIDFILDDPNDI